MLLLSDSSKYPCDTKAKAVAAVPVGDVQCSDVAPRASIAAQLVLELLNAHFELYGKARKSLGTALRSATVRKRLPEEMCKELGYIAGGADAFRHLTGSDMNNTLRFLRVELGVKASANVGSGVEFSKTESREMGANIEGGCGDGDAISTHEADSSSAPCTELDPDSLECWWADDDCKSNVGQPNGSKAVWADIDVSGSELNASDSDHGEELRCEVNGVCIGADEAAQVARRHGLLADAWLEWRVLVLETQEHKQQVAERAVKVAKAKKRLVEMQDTTEALRKRKRLSRQLLGAELYESIVEHHDAFLGSIRAKDAGSANAAADLLEAALEKCAGKVASVLESMDFGPDAAHRC